MNFRRFSLLLWFALWCQWTQAATPDPSLQTLELTVDGVQRTALVYVPQIAAGQTVPLVFVFHGHGSTAANAAEVFGINRRWPEAISVYPQGLNIPSITDAEGTRAGWQHNVGEVGDRDLHFFDMLLAKLKREHPVDAKRIYATGHSNGGGFTYLLWLARGDVFAAVAPCSAAPKFTAELKAKPAFLGAGKADPLIAYGRQQAEAETLRKVNGCAESGEPWEDGAGTEFASKGGTPLVTYFYEGGHAMNPQEAALAVKFFQENPAAR